ncbi:hypothetical protein G5714_024713 [Onychostoma macrolepis]|uniref:Uncharacterized protein n=1 Tax=Onychostoma macrolepis TaxID=369639 RepID=A0A7J6BHJ5_9TELE|nr:hypothetical protein G5714_024713 [Onychostoma macrolepis]
MPGRAKPEETLVEARSGPDVQIGRPTWAPDADAHQTPEKVLVDIDSRTVAMEVGTAKECVTTHLPNQLALKMDGAGAPGPYPPPTARKVWSQRYADE